MSETEKENSTNETTQPKKKKSKILLIAGLLVVLLIGGAGGFYFWNKSRVTAAETAETESKGKGKKSSSKKSADEDEEKSEKPEKAEKDDSIESSLPDDESVKHVVELQPFIVNLTDADSARYLRMSVSLGIGDEGEEEKPDPLFLTRVKNAMLEVLTTKKSEDVLTVEGKSKLRQQLLKAAQAASEKPHVEAIYITDFIVQL